VTQKHVTIGSVGPLLYEDTTHYAINTDGQMFVGTAPTIPEHVVRLNDLISFTGIIVLWSGSIGSIPSGWVICDGTNGTPDLRDRFVIGAGSTYNPDDVGGADTVNIAHTHSADGTLATDSISAGTPSGTNSVPTFTGDAVSASSTDGSVDLVAPDVTATGVSPVTTATGTISAPTFTGDALAGHAHDVTGETDSQLSATQSVLNPYYALAYIMHT